MLIPEHKLNGRAQSQGSEIAVSDKGVVAADDARCSEVGASILRKRGHAVDAAVATALCLGVVNPMASGIGGGAFMVVWSSSTSQALAFDMRETAPSAASEVHFLTPCFGCWTLQNLYWTRWYECPIQIRVRVSNLAVFKKICIFFHII